MQNILRNLRELFSFTQEQLAYVLEVPVEIIRQIESGSLSAHYNYLVKIADFFHITIDSLLDYKGPNKFEEPPPSLADLELLRIYISLDEISKGKLYARAVALANELTQKKA